MLLVNTLKVLFIIGALTKFSILTINNPFTHKVIIIEVATATKQTITCSNENTLHTNAFVFPSKSKEPHSFFLESVQIRVNPNIFLQT